MTGNDIVVEAFSIFAAWCREHDPDGEMGTDEAIAAYTRWCAQHSPKVSDE